MRFRITIEDYSMGPTMKILICRVTDVGIVLRSKQLMKNLMDEGHEIVVAAPKGAEYNSIIEMGCRFIDVAIKGHGTNPVEDYLLYRRYRRLLKAERPDLVLLYTTKPNIYCGIACRLMKIPAIMNITGLGLALGNAGFMQRFLIGLYRLACNGTNLRKIFFQNEESLRFFRECRIGNPEVFRMIHGSGVDLTSYPVQPFPTSATVDFLFVARVMKQKGIEEYLGAAKAIRQSHPEAVFHILGGCDSVYQERLERETRENTVVYHGKVNNIPDYQRLSQCTVQPSYYPEGVSNVILEAASSGRPVITTDHPGCREGVDDGITGYIVPIRDTKALINAIERFLNLTVEERKEMGLRGRKKWNVNLIRELSLKHI